MAEVKFTAGRVNDFKCTTGKTAFLWDAVHLGLGLRATPAGSKAYIFQPKLQRQVIRMTLGDPATRTIDAARQEAARLRLLVDQRRDPRQVRADALAAEKAARGAKAAEREAAKVKQIVNR